MQKRRLVKSKRSHAVLTYLRFLRQALYHLEADAPRRARDDEHGAGVCVPFRRLRRRVGRDGKVYVGEDGSPVRPRWRRRLERRRRREEPTSGGFRRARSTTVAAAPAVSGRRTSRFHCSCRLLETAGGGCDSGVRATAAAASE